MEAVGYDSAVVLYNKETGDGYRMGTDAGTTFLGARSSIYIDFVCHITGTRFKGILKL